MSRLRAGPQAARRLPDRPRGCPSWLLLLQACGGSWQADAGPSGPVASAHGSPLHPPYEGRGAAAQHTQGAGAEPLCQNFCPSSPVSAISLGSTRQATRRSSQGPEAASADRLDPSFPELPIPASQDFRSACRQSPHQRTFWLSAQRIFCYVRRAPSSPARLRGPGRGLRVSSAQAPSFWAASVPPSPGQAVPRTTGKDREPREKADSPAGTSRHKQVLFLAPSQPPLYGYHRTHRTPGTTTRRHFLPHLQPFL